jgi:dihydroorotase
MNRGVEIDSAIADGEAFGDPAAGDLWHRGADGGDEHAGRHMKIEIRNGRLIDPKHGVDLQASLFIAAGKVAAVGEPPAGWHANRVIDATRLIICPGLIDVSARLREPGFEYKATLESEMEAAIAGGVTSLACPPDTDPPLDEPGLVEMLKHRARSLNRAQVHPVGALTVGLKGETITEMGELSEAGCVAFSQADAPLADTQVLLRAMQYAATFGYRVWLGRRTRILRVAASLTAKSPPGSAWRDSVVRRDVALDTILAFAKATGVHVHLARLSTHEAVARVRSQRDGLAVTCDVAVNHDHHLCDIDIGWFNANCHLVPPLRGSRDRDGLRAGLPMARST